MTLYINLEPCCCWGKTPPCVDALIKAGVSRVVISNPDPNPLVQGRSIARLRRAGISVDVGLLAREGEQLNEVFFKNMKASLPFVAVKAAVTLDGKTATRGGESKWITGEEARLYGRRLRDKYDAVLVGINTLLKDDPGLKGREKKPVPIVIDPELRIPLKARVLKNADKRMILIASFAARGQKKKLAALENRARVIFAGKKKNAFDPGLLLKRLYREGICSLYVEGGSFTVGRFFDRRCVDKVYFFIAPKIFGGSAALPAIGGKGIGRIKDAVKIEKMKIKKIGDDLFCEGYPRFQRGVKSPSISLRASKKEKG